jgi:hypothetical protein
LDERVGDLSVAKAAASSVTATHDRIVAIVMARLASPGE